LKRVTLEFVPHVAQKPTLRHPQRVEIGNAKIRSPSWKGRGAPVRFPISRRDKSRFRQPYTPLRRAEVPAD